ncbi:hypothetical protein HaLaN_20911, partial [Haematococcus lacustris]
MLQNCTPEYFASTLTVL